MNLAFLDDADWDYDAASVLGKPMGGSQSAMCYLAAALAARGHRVTLFTATSNPRLVLGIDCRSKKTLSADALADCDALIVLNGPPQSCHALRPKIPAACRLILWTQHSFDQPVMKALSERTVQAGWDRIVCVSQWHRATLTSQLRLDDRRVTFIRNAISPAFAGLFDDAAALASAKSPSPVLAYTSTPFRGLDVLLAVLPRIRRRHPDVRLRVYSSMKVYDVDAQRDPYADLYKQCKAMPGVEYIGSIPQAELARAMRSAWLLSYPCTFAETSCIAAMEAMAAGLGVVTSELGALPETTMGFGAMTPVGGGSSADFPRAYADLLSASLDQIHADPERFWKRRWEQVRAMNQSTSAVRAEEWEQLLRTLVPGAPLKTRRTVDSSLQTAIQFHQSSRLEEAERIYRQMLEHDPNHPDALHLLGMVAHASGRPEEALKLVRRAVARLPDHAVIRCNLGVIHQQAGRLDEAIAEYRRAVALRSDYAAAHYNLANALAAQRQPDQAIEEYQHAIRLAPDYAEAHNNLGRVLADVERLDESIAEFSSAIRIRPDYAEALANLGEALKSQGRIDEAIQAIDRAIQLKPDPHLHSNRLVAINYHPDYDSAAILREQRRWDQLHGGAPRVQLERRRASSPRLRIGYVSPAFCDHVVGRNILPLLREHDHNRFEVVCFSDARTADRFTGEFRAHADVWHETAKLNDAQLAELVVREKIDILVDLNMHAAGGRLGVFARKPAPVQVTFASYPGGVGMEAIGYRLTDPHLDPPGSDANYVEKSIRAVQSFWCYDPAAMMLGMDSQPEVGPLPALQNSHVTFGCLNNFAKTNRQVFALWARVLAAVQRSTLLLMAPRGNARQAVADQLAADGIDPGRIGFVSRLPQPQYMEMYRRIDISLDTIPYNGHTSSLDSLWMGVPVVTLIGKTIVGRAGLSQLTNLGLPELIADTPDRYVRITAELAGDLARLADLRATLRQRMLNSPLTDAPAFARGIEAAYGRMWQSVCEAVVAGS